MEPMPFYFDSINRNAFIIRPKAPFFNWLSTVFPEEDIDKKEECNVYLLREMDHNGQIHDWIKRNFGDIFENELNDWYTDEAKWPSNRDIKMFNEWFEIEVHSMVLDIEETEITKD
jgi:hypothetical protein